MCLLPDDLGEITITVVRASRGKVRLGITAPPAVKIFRAELIATAPREEEEPE